MIESPNPPWGTGFGGMPGPQRPQMREERLGVGAGELVGHRMHELRARFGRQEAGFLRIIAAPLTAAKFLELFPDEPILTAGEARRHRALDPFALRAVALDARRVERRATADLVRHPVRTTRKHQPGGRQQQRGEADAARCDAGG